jgi:putative endopeptidase
MNRVCITALLCCITACSDQSTPTDVAPAGASALGFTPSDLSTDKRPQDDFFAYVNGQWIERTEIPPEWSRYGTMQIVSERTEVQVRKLIEQAANDPDAKAGSDTRRIGDLYSSFMDETKANELGLAPIAAELANIAVLETHAELFIYFAKAMVDGVTVPINFYIDANAANPNESLAYLWQDGLGLPDRDYYLEDSPSLIDVRQKYALHIEKLFVLAGLPGGANAGKAIPALEKRIAAAHWSRVQNRDRQTIYTNKFTPAQAAALSPGLPWGIFLENAGFGRPEQIIIAQTDYFAALGKLVREIPLPTWKAYLQFHTLESYAPYVSNAFVRENFDFARGTLRGQQEMRARWKRGVILVDTSIGELVGKRYIDAHFPPAAKQRIDIMIENLRDAFRQSIDSLEWMTAETRAAAQEKLAAFSTKIGYPDDWRDYTGLEIDADDLVGNVRRARRFEHHRQVAKLSQPVDRGEWGMTPQTINAYYRPTLNEIVFPAAILQPPFFDFAVDDAVNYGAIGTVIGHEFSHGFDDQGRKFDGTGRLADWWTTQDAKQYEQRSQGLVTQYDSFQALPTQAVNGELTLGENIADLAGLIVAYRAWQILLDGQEAEVINGYSGAERFFIGYAQAWRTKVRDEYLLKMLLSDPHSPPRYRVNGTLRNVPEFYDTFDIGPDDGMYIPREERVSIW